MSLVRTAVRWTATAAIAKALLQVAQVAILARLLTPEDYGLIAIVGTVQGFAALFADLGLSSAFVHRQAVTQDQRSSLFWMNTAFSGALAVGLVALAKPAGAFYGDPRLAQLLMWSALLIVLGGLGQQVRLAAEKALNFVPVMSIEMLAAAVGFAAAVLGALSGLGVYALICGALGTTLTATAMAWLVLSDGWRPRLHFRWDDVKPFLGFGVATVGESIANQVNVSLDLLIGGRILGAAQLGLYSVPRNLILQVQFLVNPVVTRVGFPVIAQIQGDVERVREVYLRTVNLTASANAPIYVGLAAFAPQVVAALLGEQWERAADVLRWLAAWGLLRSFVNPVGSLLLGMGRANLSLKWNVGLLPVVGSASWLGAQWGAVGMAVSMLLVMAALFVPVWYVLIRPVCGAGFVEYSRAALVPVAISIAAVLPSKALASAFDEAVSTAVLGTVLSAALYLSLSSIFNRDFTHALAKVLGYRSNGVPSD